MRGGWVLGSGLALMAAASCLAGAPQGIVRETAGGGAGGADFGTTNDTSTTPTSTGTGSNDPHAVLGADPGHGPFNGGGRVIVSGKGFGGDARVWFGDVEALDVIAIDPSKLQVTVPPGEPGAVDLSAQNGDDASTLRTLPGGYTYDALYAQPDSGPVAGGTVISIFGKDTTWDQDVSEALIDNKPCTTLDVLGPSELQCTVPKGTQGAKSITVVTSNDTVTALDAYTYQDSDDGYKGGLGGNPIAGTLKVLVYDNFTGDPVVGAHVVVGNDLSTGLYQQVDNTGVTVFNDPSLDQPVTVTVAAECHSPISFVDVPVDSVTTYLNPVLTPSCASDGDPPPTGGGAVLTGIADGELVWPSEQEFQKGGWSNVPAPQGTYEKRVAYVFYAQTNPQADFYVPSAAYQVDESSPGDLGYGFSVPGFPGNQTLYAVAGIRNTQTNKFYGYAFGAVQGVSLTPGEVTENVYIGMDFALDQALVMNAAPPPVTAKGPDRLHATVAVELAAGRYAILPAAQKTPLLPLAQSPVFVGLPPLDQALTGARYISSAEAVTGPSLGAPLSVVNAVATTTTSIPVDVSGFVAVAQLSDPLVGGAWDGKHLAVSYPSGGFPADLTVYEVVSGNDLVRWVIAVPQAANAIELPDISVFPDAGIPHGSIVIGVYGARIDGFDYGTISYANLRPRGMDAYSLDYFNAHW